MSLPPDEPTRPLGRPIEPLEPAYRETVVAPDDSAFRAEVLDRLGALRVWVALATLLSLVAIGLAAWTFFEEDDDRDVNRGNGVRAAEVETLEERLDRLESQPAGVRAADLSAVQDEQAALADQVNDLAAQVEAAAQQEPAATEDLEARESINALDQSIQDLDARVRALESQSAP